MDRNDFGDMGEVGGVGGKRNVSPVGAAAGDFLSVSSTFGPSDSGGVEGGVRIFTCRVGSTKLWVGGGLYVIPMAPCRPARSRFWGINATVTSPSPEPGFRGGTGIRMAHCLPVTLGSSHRSSVRIFSLSKYFQLLIRRAVAGSASISVFVPLPGNWRNVVSLQ